MRELKWTLMLVGLCACWHLASAFFLNGKNWTFLGMPAWFSCSVLGSILIVHLGLWFLLKHVFIDFDYDEESSEDSKS